LNDNSNKNNNNDVENKFPHQFHNWKIGTINIRTGKERDEGGKIYLIAKEVAKAGLTLCLLQEVRYLNTGVKRIRLNTGEQYDFIWCGPKKKRETGVGLLIKVDKKIVVSEPDVQDPRIATNVIINGFKIRLVNAYSPTNTDGSIAQKDDFYRKLRKACIKKEKNFKLVIAGDFNAITSIVLRQSFFDGKKL